MVREYVRDDDGSLALLVNEEGGLSIGVWRQRALSELQFATCTCLTCPLTTFAPRSMFAL